MPDNYPDGVSTSDIPGFRQYDEELDRLYDAAKKDFGRELSGMEMDTIESVYQYEGFEAAMDFVGGFDAERALIPEED